MLIISEKDGVNYVKDSTIISAKVLDIKEGEYMLNLYLVDGGEMNFRIKGGEVINYILEHFKDIKM